MEKQEEDLAARPVTRPFLHALGRHASWNEQTVKTAFFGSGIYPDRKKWLTWSVRFFAGTGTAFLLIGTVLFFAWNWADMSRTLKFGVIEGAIGLVTLAALLLRKKHEFAFKLGLTIVTVLIGVLFAVQGQEYQTGANSFILFRNWSIAVLLIVAVSHYPPLWLLYTALLNVVVITGNNQFGEVHTNFLFTELFLVNTLVLIAWEILQARNVSFTSGRWFPRIAGLAAIVYITTCIMGTNHGEMRNDEVVCTALVTPALFAGALYYGRVKKDLFFLALFGFSSILIIASKFSVLFPERNLSFSEAGSYMDRMYKLMLVRGLFIITSSSLLGVGLVKLNKKWRNHA